MFRTIKKWLLNKTYKPVINFYLRKKRTIAFEGLTIEVWPGVFHPALFYSTKFFCNFLSALDLQKKRILELGCGTGALACYAAMRGGVVTASDINNDAVANCQKNSFINKLQVLCVQSDLFDKLHNAVFDIIVINPPYYRGEARDVAQKAWYAGPELEYFEKLFYQLQQRHQPEQVYMILSEDCELSAIEKIALNHDYILWVEKSYSTFFETNHVYSIKKRG